MTLPLLLGFLVGVLATHEFLLYRAHQRDSQRLRQDRELETIFDREWGE